MPSVSQGHSNSFNKSFFFWFLRLSNEPPNPFPKQTHSKTHTFTYNGHNLSILRKKKNDWISNHFLKWELELWPIIAVNTFPLFSKGHVSHQSSSHQVNPRFHVKRWVLSPCRFIHSQSLSLPEGSNRQSMFSNLWQWCLNLHRVRFGG